MPASSEIIFEGVIPPKVRVMEGPFGESNGYYGKTFCRPILKLNAITQRENPIYQATYTGKRPKEEHFISAFNNASSNSSTKEFFSLRTVLPRIFPSDYRRLKLELNSKRIKLPAETVTKLLRTGLHMD